MTENEFKFVTCRSYAVLVNYTGHTADRIIVPCFYQGKPVKEIGAGVFYEHSEIKEVFLPYTVERIDVNAFGWTRQLRSVSIGDPEKEATAICSIESYAFQYSTLGQIELQAKMIEIDDYAFANCSIKSIVMPTCIDLRVEDHAFSNSRLQYIQAPLLSKGVISSIRELKKSKRRNSYNANY